MSRALSLSKALQRSQSLQRTIVKRSIASHTSAHYAPQAMLVQATNINLAQHSLVNAAAKKVPPTKTTTTKSRKIRRLSGVSASTSSKPDEDLIVDMEALEALASQPPTPLRLKDLYTYGTSQDSAQRLRNAQFLHKEIPIRMAQRAMDLLTLPHGLNEISHIKQVASIYLKYIEEFQQTAPPSNTQEEKEFTDMLQNIILDRQKIPISISKGISSWYASNKHDINPQHLEEMDAALYRFFTARVGLRFLTQHHILSDKSRNSKLLEYARTDLGCIETDCNPVAEIEIAIQKVRQQTLDCYGSCPEITLVDCRPENSTGFTYVPHHLQYMVMELLKNACRATVDKYYDGEDDEGEMPEIKVVVVQGKEDVTIKVCDVGGGAPRSTMDKIWKFAHSTSPSLEQETSFAHDSFSGGAKIRGFGLPLARIYARYFGGELTLRSMEGHGVDAYLYLPRLGYQCEKLPSLVKKSPGEGDSTVDLYTMAPIVRRNNDTAVNGETTSDTAEAVL